MTTTIYVGDCLEVLPTLPEKSVQCVVTSPPYWQLRSYNVDGQHGLEPTFEDWLATQVEVFRAVRRVLRDDGTLWLNIGDSYGSGQSGESGSSKTSTTTSANNGANRRGRVSATAPKQLIGQPWRLAFALRDDGWWLRSDIIWHKPNPMPESVTDRPTKSHEHIFLLTKRSTYYYDADAVREAPITTGLHQGSPGGDQNTRRGGRKYVHSNDPGRSGIYCGIGGRNLRDVWTIPTESFSGAHFATFPRKLVEPCLKAGTSERGCCPACGAPWVRVVEKSKVGDWGRHDEFTAAQPNGLRGEDFYKQYKPATTIGWRPGCGCVPDGSRTSSGDLLGASWQELAALATPVPCTVLDPYCGSGTVGVVAKQMGLHFVGIELNPAYAEMARKRIENPEPLPEVKDKPGQEVWEFA